MNKQEALKKIEKLDGLTIKDNDFSFDIEMIPKGEALEIVSQLDEPVKPVVPQFVAEWIESQKESFSDASAIDMYDNLTLDNNGGYYHEVWLWVIAHHHDFIKAWHDDYEVEKEKLYTVKFANENFGKMYIGIFKKFNKLGISSLPLNDDEVKLWFTEDELKRFKFWDNPAFEVTEVEDNND